MILLRTLLHYYTFLIILFSFNVNFFNFTGIKLLKMAQEDYEQLENDQLLVQAMMGSRFLRTFERAVNEWNSSLSVVGDVVQALVVVR